MNDNYGKVNLDDVADLYAQYGMQEHGTARYVRTEIGAASVGLTHYDLEPGKRVGFAHRHKQDEELYIVVRGSGRIKIDDDTIALAARDVVRIAPQCVRECEAGPDGLELIAAGGHSEDDGETIADWWPAEDAQAVSAE